MHHRPYFLEKYLCAIVLFTLYVHVHVLQKEQLYLLKADDYARDNNYSRKYSHFVFNFSSIWNKYLKQ